MYTRTELSPRYCVRCGEETHGTAEDQPHLCADLSKRYARRKKQVDAVVKILQQDIVDGFFGQGLQKTAEDIVIKLANLGVEDDI